MSEIGQEMHQILRPLNLTRPLEIIERSISGKWERLCLEQLIQGANAAGAIKMNVQFYL